MPIIELPHSVSSKIAAGEVVERPVSVVKELIENAIDANATEIIIRIKGSGQSLIEVEDNGEGISAEDIKKTVRRYATSKISSVEDLNNIQTLGFRGEALASIAAVSRFTLESRFFDEKQGTQLIFEGGILLSNKLITRRQGTRIRVEDLFFNVPARRKFLKKEVTEKRQISDLIYHYALFYSQIRFVFDQDGRIVFKTYGRGDRLEILASIINLGNAKKLLEINYADSMVEIKGFSSPTDLTRSTRKDIIHFVNGRLVSDSTLTSAVIRAYHGFLMSGRFPITYLFIIVDPGEIDVNVHPTKAEIRFREQGKLFSAVHSAIKKVISVFSPVPSFSPEIWSNSTSSKNIIDPAWKFVEKEKMPSEERVVKSDEDSNRLSAVVKVPLLRPIGQLGRLYIAAEGPDGLYLIDQHSAHERILYEKFTQSNDVQAASQILLEPVVIHLGDYLTEVLKSQSGMMIKIGFRFEEFGPKSIRLSALPAAIQHMNPEYAFLGALEPDDEDDNFFSKEMEKRMIARICKRTAIKGGQLLSTQEQEKLIRDLENCESPRTCPHGRPTMIHLSVDLLARQFGRLGSR